MTQIKKAGIAGLLIVALNLVIGLYFTIKISSGFTFEQSYLPEIKSLLLKLFIFSLPGFIMLFRKNIYFKHGWTPWLYPFVVGLGLIFVYTASDALAAGLFMMFTVIPFCIIFSIVILLKKKKSE